MRKAFLLVLILVSGVVFGQEALNHTHFVIQLMCINSLNKPVITDGAIRVDRNNYIVYDSLGSILYSTEDNIVIKASIGDSFDTTHEALMYLSKFYDFFESNKWEYFKNGNQEYYEKDGIIALFVYEKRIDNKIASGVIFRKSMSEGH